MPRSSSGEPTKPSKRKGTRSVSTLTPSQLARKRANDREAQRAIRARTKEHIERLERELAELKGVQSRDRKVQELLRRNKFLEQEIARLREHMGYTATDSSYSSNSAGTPGTMPNNAHDLYFGPLTPGPSVYDDNLSSGSGAVPSPRVSPLPSSDFNQIPDYAQQSYGHITGAGGEAWPASVAPNPVLGNISSPSSPAHGEEYSAAYIPTSVPSMIPATLKDIKQDYDEMDHGSGLRLNTSTLHNLPQAYMQQHQHQQQNQHQHQHPQHPQHHHHQQAAPPPPPLHAYAQQHQQQPPPHPAHSASPHTPLQQRTPQWNAAYSLYYPPEMADSHANPGIPR
ncbi:uncharacterized protein Triagg1_2797 [Trichoderma aggressivum f. europaeum]|uniref:BZIP domain-containing protein n=1 Tax=Trichoderma aggressivum f. europaeum TaxID=173218 RepID=A0AAE1JB88_9HYPO|nr:hypothetical protein Triagg1_2797 [Trichoderma aggressivum f. europaeum]